MTEAQALEMVKESHSRELQLLFTLSTLRTRELALTKIVEKFAPHELGQLPTMNDIEHYRSMLVGMHVDNAAIALAHAGQTIRVTKATGQDRVALRDFNADRHNVGVNLYDVVTEYFGRG